jgi:hypothetical protein
MFLNYKGTHEFVLKELNYHIKSLGSFLFWFGFFLIYQGFYFLFFFLLFLCAYNAWVTSPPCPHSLPYHPHHPLSLPHTSSIPGRNYFALISNFVEERV